MSGAEGPFFIDTNILIYAIDTQDAAKHNRSRALIESLPHDAIVLSAQVINEFFFTVTRKLRRPLALADAEAAVRALSSFRILALDHRLSLSAIELVRKHQLSVWDALVVQSALDARCRTLYSEDFQHGRKYGDVRVVNPFVP
jgi:predicted nucleic acid-binding protein